MIFSNGLAKASINLWYSFEMHLITGTPEKKKRSNEAEISKRSFICYESLPTCHSFTDRFRHKIQGN